MARRGAAGVAALVTFGSLAFSSKLSFSIVKVLRDAARAVLPSPRQESEARMHSALMIQQLFRERLRPRMEDASKEAIDDLLAEYPVGTND